MTELKCNKRANPDRERIKLANSLQANYPPET